MHICIECKHAVSIKSKKDSLRMLLKCSAFATPSQIEPVYGSEIGREKPYCSDVRRIPGDLAFDPLCVKYEAGKPEVIIEI
jgi:hypothetical protein